MEELSVGKRLRVPESFSKHTLRAANFLPTTPAFWPVPKNFIRRPSGTCLWMKGAVVCHRELNEGHNHDCHTNSPKGRRILFCLVPIRTIAFPSAVHQPVF
jgi:hypothetical protein